MLSKQSNRAYLTSKYDSHVNGLLLTLYLTSTNKSIDALLAQEVEGVEHLV